MVATDIEISKSWRPLPRQLIAKAIASFGPSQVAAPNHWQKNFVALQVGDTIQIVEECHGWYRGFVFPSVSFSPASTSAPLLGVFPSNFVSILDLTIENIMQARRSIGHGTSNITRRKSPSYSSGCSPSSPNSATGPHFHGLPIPEKGFKSALRTKANQTISTSTSQLSSTTGNSIQNLLATQSASLSDIAIPAVPPLPAGLVQSHQQSIVPVTPQEICPVNELRPRADTLHPVYPAIHSVCGLTEPLIDEIAATLQDWCCCMRMLLTQQRYKTVQVLKQLFDMLLQGRRQLVMETLSEDEVVKVKRDLIAAIYHGNSLLGLPAVLRHPEKGYMLGIENASISRLFKVQYLMSRPLTVDRDLTTSSSAFANSELGYVPLSFHTATRDKATLFSEEQKLGHLYCDITLPDFRLLPQLFGLGGIFSPEGDELVEISAGIYHYAKTPSKRGFITEDFFALCGVDGKPRNVAKLFSADIYNPNLPMSTLSNLARQDVFFTERNVTLFTNLHQIEFSENNSLFLVVRLVKLGRFSGLQDNTNSSSVSRRPFGVGVLDLGSLSGNLGALNDFAVHFVHCSNEQQFSTIHELIISDRKELTAPALTVNTSNTTPNSTLNGASTTLPNSNSLNTGNNPSLSLSSSFQVGQIANSANQASMSLSQGVPSSTSFHGASMSASPGNFLLSSGTGNVLTNALANVSQSISGSGIPGVNNSLTASMGGESRSNTISELFNIRTCLRFFSGDKNVLTRQFPLLSKDVVFTDRKGFSEFGFLYSAEEKNTLYVTFCEADFNSFLKKSSSKAIEARCEVRWLETANGKDSWVLNAETVSRGSNAAVPKLKTIKLVSFANTLTPKWQETLQFDIPAAVHGKAHLLITFYALSGNVPAGKRNSVGSSSAASSSGQLPFAFAVLPFKRGDSILADGMHELAAFKYDENYIGIPAMYLGLPLWANSAPEPPSDIKVASVSAQSFASTHMLKDTLKVKTELYSTKFSKNPGLLSLLQFRNNPALATSAPTSLRLAVDVLQSFRSTVDTLDMARFLSEILDTLFALLASPANADGDLNLSVLETLCLVLDSVAGPKGSKYKNVVENYIDEGIAKFPNVWCELFKSLEAVISDPIGKEYSNRVFKAWHFVARIALRSFQDHVSKISDKESKEELLDDIRSAAKSLLLELNTMVGSLASIKLIGAQSTAIQNFSPLLSELMPIFSSTELAGLAIAFVDSIKASKFIIQVHRIYMIHTLLKNPLFKESRSRLVFIEAATKWIRQCLCGEWDPLSYLKSSAAQQPHENGHAVDESSNSSSWFSAHSAGISSISSQAKEREAQREMTRLCICLTAELIDWSLDNIKSTSKGATETAIGEIAYFTKGLMQLFPILASILYDVTLSQLSSQNPPSVSGNSDVAEIGIVFCSMLRYIVFYNPNTCLYNFFCSYCEAKGRPAGADLFLKIIFAFQTLVSGRYLSPQWTLIRIVVVQTVSKCVSDFTLVLDNLFSGIPSTVAADKMRHSVATSTAFYSKLWTEYFRVIAMLLNGELSDLETLPEQGRRLVSRMRADYRPSIAHLLAERWRKISTFESQFDKQGSVSSFLLDSCAKFQESLIPPLLMMCLEMMFSPNSSLREEAGPLFLSVIEKEARMTGGDLSRIGVLLIEGADDLLMVRKAATFPAKYAFIRLVVRELATRCDKLGSASSERNRQSTFGPDKTERDSATSWLTGASVIIKELVQYAEWCFVARTLPESKDWDDERITAMLHLLDFIRRIDMRQMFIRYISELALVQVRRGNAAEAAMLLQLHADTLDWTDAPVLLLDGETVPSYQLKRRLFTDMVQLHEKGQLWEAAAKLCKEWVAFEESHNDFGELYRLLERESMLYRKIVNEERFAPSYFRVGFYGLGWPAMLRNEQFVYRGDPLERISVFVDQMLSRYTGTQLIKGNGPVASDVVNGCDRWMQIVAVKPESIQLLFYSEEKERESMRCKPALRSLKTRGAAITANELEKKSNLWDPVGVEDSIAAIRSLNGLLELEDSSAGDENGANFIPSYIQSFYSSNQTRVFTFERPIKKTMVGRSGKEFLTRNTQQNEFLQLWIERSILVTEEPLPSWLRRSKVVEVERIELCPIENALATMRSKSKELRQLARKYGPFVENPTSEFNLNPLTMSLNGAVDAPVNGGVKMYKETFLGPVFVSEFPEMATLVQLLQDEILDQVCIVDQCLHIHQMLVPKQMEPLHNQLMLLFVKNFRSEYDLITKRNPQLVLHARSFAEESAAQKETHIRQGSVASIKQQITIEKPTVELTSLFTEKSLPSLPQEAVNNSPSMPSPSFSSSGGGTLKWHKRGSQKLGLFFGPKGNSSSSNSSNNPAIPENPF